MTDEKRDMRNLPDLGALRNHDEKAKQAQFQKILTDNGLLCPCGEKIGTQGVMIFFITEGLIPTDQGLLPGTTLGTISFHSRDCAQFVAVLNWKEPKPIAVRDIASTEWLVEDSE